MFFLILIILIIKAVSLLAPSLTHVGDILPGR